MFRNYFKTALRNIKKNKLYAAINIFGLAVGLTACLLIGIYIQHELSYDTFNVNADRIVRATMEYGQAGTVNTTATTGTKVGPQFKRTFPAVEEYVRTYLGQSVIKNNDKLFDEQRLLYADPAFFKMFSFKIIEGDAGSALSASDKIVLTKSMAIKYFGNENVVGKRLSALGKELTVSAVCEDAPQNSQLKFDFVTQFLNLRNVSEENWWTANWITYFLVKNAAAIPQLQKQVEAYMKTPQVRTEARLEGESYLTYHLEPLKSVHLHSALPGFEPNGNIRYIYMFMVVALLILVIACANYTNLATAQSAARTGEIGMRKVMGASKMQVFMQFIGESSVITIIAAALSIMLCIVLIPYFNELAGKAFTAALLLQPSTIIALVVFAVMVSFFAGLYPAIILSGTHIMSVLKKGFNFTGGNGFLRKALIVVQFGVSVFLIIYTIIIMQQMHYMQNTNLGYNKDHVVVLPVSAGIAKEFESFKTALQQVSGVESVTASYETPEYVGWGDGITATDEKGNHDVSVNAMPVDLDFINTMKMQLVAGRDFQLSDFAMMDTANNNVNFRQPFLINETLAKKIGWNANDAINKTINKGDPGPVLGVVKDFNFSSLHDAIGPMVIFLSRDLTRDFMIRINGNDMQATVQRLETLWKQRVPDRPFTYHFLDDDYNKLYLSEQRTASLFTVAAAIAIVLASLGLFALAAFTTVQRTKEIGIRRILGADTKGITILIAKSFIQLVMLAIIIAVPLAWWAGNTWLQDFAFRIPVKPYVFLLTGAATVLIAFCTVGYHAVKVSLSNPVKSLRTE